MTPQVEVDMEPRDDSSDGQRPLKEVMSGVSGELGELVKKEVELAKTEVKDKVGQVAKAGAAFAGAGVTAFFAVQVLSFAAAFGLALILPRAVAFAIVGVLYLLACAALFLMGRKKLANLKPVPERTLHNVKEDVKRAKTSFTRGMQGPTTSSGSLPVGSTYPGRMWRGNDD